MEASSVVDFENSVYAKRAMDLFCEGYNCAQAVFFAFSDQYDLDRESVLAISSSFGGGIARLREVCGSVSGMCMAAGLIFGYTSPTDHEAKTEHYALIQRLVKRFEAANGSIVCRELLGLKEKHQMPEPELRAAQYYKKRPCPQLVGMSAAILEEELKKRGREIPD